MTTKKPVIKLPPNNKSTYVNRPGSYRDVTQYESTFVSKDLFFEDEENRLSYSDIESLFQEYNILNIKRERGGGYLSFPDSKIADRVYSLFNGYTFANQAILKLRISADDMDEPQPEGSLLEVRNLPSRIDHNALYDIFRPYGPLNICKTIPEEGTQNTKALIQYFSQEDSDNAVSKLNGKEIENNVIRISSFVMSNLATSRNNTTMENKPEGLIDFMNLYVKNLDPTVNSTELFELFRSFGRIVSARVMSNPQNGLSKGYGFVSFSKPEEAALALQKMKGFQFRNKSMIVAYHEPKKPRQEKSSSTTTSSFHSPPPSAPIDYATTPYFETRHPHEGLMNGLNMDHTDHLAMNMKDLAIGTTMQRKVSAVESNYPPRHSPPFVARPSLASLASGASIQPVPPHAYKKVESRKIEEDSLRPLRRKSSLESVNSIMTESSAQMQRVRMTEAVKNCGSFGKELNDIVDMLLTLKRKERSLCLFNTDFLKEKISAALEALEICEDEDVVIEQTPIKPMAMVSTEISPPRSPVKKPSVYQNPVAATVRKSKAIPIVAPPTVNSSKTMEIEALLSSLEGKSTHEKKQLLGDQLFPLVKATGVKPAPKITIRLLDTVKLEELARIMFDKDALRVQVDKAAASL
ncbi:Polyadenylate-binding protein 4 [Choanephora cucurbitarum]|uniref:Polyadenylate-binding protein 4 n=1 Tax=Choanephora cucurbitarum TaxID=101091 RepID=A0A1C7NQW0_9FUNG|nr:Polyadenylate-binding protein 4 [Choanephora cucurbitarum]